MTSAPPTVLSSGQRAKMISRLTNALSGDVSPAGVPTHLRSAYGGGKLIPAGQIIVMRGEVESVENPPWWNQDTVMSVMDHVCEKLVSAYEEGITGNHVLTILGPQHWHESNFRQLSEEAIDD